jgi:hypothetical protein
VAAALCQGWRERPSRPAAIGKPATYDSTFRDRVLALLEQPPPAGLGHWDGRAVAEALGASVHAVWRLLRREGIYLQRLRTWCVSTDPEFAPKAAEVVGLYLNPPLNALVLSVDEKPSIQAIQRPSGYVETDSGAVVRAMKSTYKRNGTLNLFAALEIATGQVYVQTTEQKKREDFRRSLDSVVAELPAAGRSMSSWITTALTKRTMTGWQSTKDECISISRQLPPAGSTRSRSGSACLRVRRYAARAFSSKDQLRAAIEAFVTRTNDNPKPFHWRKREVKGSQLRNTIINLCN